MMMSDLQHKETLLLETLLSGLDARESARSAGSGMLLYLSELIVHRAREELEQIRGEIETAAAGAVAVPDRGPGCLSG